MSEETPAVVPVIYKMTDIGHALKNTEVNETLLVNQGIADLFGDLAKDNPDVYDQLPSLYNKYDQKNTLTYEFIKANNEIFNFNDEIYTNNIYFEEFGINKAKTSNLNV